MNVIKIPIAEISRIKPLWKQLNEYHLGLSSNFKEHFESITFEQRTTALADKVIAVWGVEEEEKLVGYALASVKGAIGEVDSLFILPEYRDKGWSAPLMQHVEAWFEEMFVEKIAVTVAEGNEQVHTFYEKLGYKKRSVTFEKGVE